MVRGVAGDVCLAASSSSSFPPGGETDERSTCWNYEDPERSFASKINLARGQEGGAALTLDPELSNVARTHATEMASRELLHHTPDDQLRRRVSNWTTLGENVGVGASVDSLHAAFMNSPLHRANVMHEFFRHVGVGVVESGGRMWVTVIFQGTADPGTTLPMPQC